jgi:hypothetical protein
MNRSRKDEQIDRLEHALIRAHEVHEAPRFSRDWAVGVMQDVRRQGNREDSFSEVPRVIWRAAAVIAVVSTLFVGSVLTWTAKQGEADVSALLMMATADSMSLTGEP